MNCRTCGEYIMKYLDGTCNDIENAQMKYHLKSCGKCMEHFNELNGIFTCVEAIEEAVPPDNFEKQVMDKIKKIKLVRYTRRSRASRLLSYFIYTASIVLFSVFIIYTYNIDFLYTFKDLASFANSIISTLPNIYYALRELYSFAGIIISILLAISILIYSETRKSPEENAK